MLNKKRKQIPNNKNNHSFLFKLYDILNDTLYQKIIVWNNDGTAILIKDTNKLSEIVLPKFFKHNNYSSFVRQLNLYGFHKSKGMIKNGELYEHEQLNKKSTKEEIEQIGNQNRRNKFSIKYIENNNKEKNLNKNDSIFINSEGEILKYLIEKNEENLKNIINLKKEIIELKAENKALNEKLTIFNNNFIGHNIFLEKLIKRKNENKTNISPQKSKNIKELFKNYLYYLRIYSPYLPLKNENNRFNKIQKTESFNIINLIDNNKKEILNYGINNINNINGININSNTFLSRFPIISQRQDMNPFALNFLNNSSSNSFFYGNKNFNNYLEINDKFFLKFD